MKKTSRRKPQHVSPQASEPQQAPDTWSSEVASEIEDRANDVRSLAAVLLAVSVALSYEKVDSSELPDQPVTLGAAEGWLDRGVELVWRELDDTVCTIQDLVFKVKGGAR